MSYGLAARELFEELAPGSTTQEVADLLQCSLPSAQKWGIYFHYQFARAASKPKISVDRYDWTVVNWEDNDATIAGQLGCSKWAVGLKRRGLGIEPSPFFGKHQEKLEAITRVLNNEGAALKISQVAARSGVSMSMARSVGMQMGYEFEPEFPERMAWYKTADINWDLPNRILADLWRSNCNVNGGQAAMGKARFRVGHAPKWDTRRLTTKPDPAYQEAIELERIKMETLG